jgi:hypothetical protein
MNRCSKIENNRNVGAPTFSDLRLGTLWSARACSRFYRVNPECQVSVITPFTESQKRRPFESQDKQAAALQNVGAPTFPNWNASVTLDSGACRDRRLRRSALGLVVVSLQSGYQATYETGPKAGRYEYGRDVGAPTFLGSRTAVRP